MMDYADLLESLGWYIGVDKDTRKAIVYLDQKHTRPVVKGHTFASPEDAERFIMRIYQGEIDMVLSRTREDAITSMSYGHR